MLTFNPAESNVACLGLNERSVEVSGQDWIVFSTLGGVKMSLSVNVSHLLGADKT